MSVSSIFGNTPSATDPLSQLYSPTSTTATTGVTSSLSSAAASTSVSGGAQLLHQLQQLAQSNPAEFQQVTSDIATQLQSASLQATGSQSQALANIADKFQQASQTGNLSSLQPKHHHHDGHHGGQQASASTAYQQTSSQSDPLTSALSGQTASPAASLQSQVSSIISQTLTKDLGSAAITASA